MASTPSCSRRQKRSGSSAPPGNRHAMPTTAIGAGLRVLDAFEPLLQLRGQQGQSLGRQLRDPLEEVAHPPDSRRRAAKSRSTSVVGELLDLLDGVDGRRDGDRRGARFEVRAREPQHVADEIARRWPRPSDGRRRASPAAGRPARGPPSGDCAARPPSASRAPARAVGGVCRALRGRRARARASLAPPRARPAAAPAGPRGPRPAAGAGRGRR